MVDACLSRGRSACAELSESRACRKVGSPTYSLFLSPMSQGVVPRGIDSSPFPPPPLSPGSHQHHHLCKYISFKPRRELCPQLLFQRLLFSNVRKKTQPYDPAE